MSEPKKLTDGDVKSIIDAELATALGVESSQLSEQRRKALAYYYAEPKGDLAPPEIEGRSSVVSPDVRNTVESMLPQLVAKFVGGDKVVQFEPTKPGDEQKADSATDYVNHLFFKKNDGHNITVTWAKDGLLQKRGIVKCWWDTRSEEKREEYKALTEVELARIMDDPEVEIEPLEHKEYPDEDEIKQRASQIEVLTQQMQQAMQAAQQPGPQQQAAAQAIPQMQQQIEMIQAQPVPMLYDVAFKRSMKGGKLSIEPVPPEEFIISRGAKKIRDALLVGHKFQRSMSELKSMGYKGLDDLGAGEDQSATENPERIERYAFDGEDSITGTNTTQDKSSQLYWVKELYLRVDQDGDGIAELRKIVYVNGKILDNEITDEAPFASWCPVPMPHKFFGLSAADLAMEGQKVKTNVRRAQLDNMYLQVNGRTFVVEGKANTDDLLDNRPGSIVRMQAPGMAGPFDNARGDLAAAAAMMEQEEVSLENSTGFTRYSQGNDGKGLNQTLGGVQIITNKADMRLDLMARNLAEGFVELFRLMLKLVCQNQKKAEQIRIAGSWVPMDPREWTNQFDIEINVGLGVGNKDQQVNHLMALRGLQVQGLQIGTATPKNIYELDTEIAKTMGFKSGDRFFNDPQKNPPPPQPNPMQAQMEVEKMKLQGQMQSKQAELEGNARIEQMKAEFKARDDEAERNYKAQLEQLTMQMQAEVDNNRQRSEAEQHALKIENEARLAQLKASYDDQCHQREMAFEQWKFEQQQGYDRWKAELDASVKIESANISSKAKVDNEATQTATREIASEVTQQPDFSALTTAAQMMAIAADKMTKPRTRTIHRGADGKATGMTEE